jgi:hypothetical protein
MGNLPMPSKLDVQFRNNVQPKWAKSLLVWWCKYCEVAMAADAAWQAWTSVCGMRVYFAPSYESADVSFNFADLGASLMASSDMPPPDNTRTRLHVRLNSRLQWAWCNGMLGLDPLRTLTHELGHVLGLVHGPKGSLMYHEYQEGIVVPQVWDIREVVERYGRPEAPILRRGRYD